MASYELMRLLLCVAAAMACEKLEVKYSWSVVDYTFPSPEERQAAIDCQSFIPENCAILDVDVFQDTDSTGSPRVFVTTPRLLPGVPATIGEIVSGSDSTGADCTLISPYPNWEANTLLDNDAPDCEKPIISAFRFKIDDFGRMWIVDVGILEIFLPDHRHVCTPKLFIYDLKNNDSLIKMYTFASTYVKDTSFLTNIVVDVIDPSDSTNTFAYIADTIAFKLIVYDFKNDDSWAVDQAYFYPYPVANSYNIAGVTFNFMDGVTGLALGPVAGNEESKMLYFHSLSSFCESWVETSVLQNKSMFQGGFLIDGTDEFFVSEDARDTQSTVEVMTDDGILITTSLDNTLVIWNSQDVFTKENLHVVYKDDELFQFPCGIKIVGDTIWVVSAQLQNILSPVEHAKAKDDNSVKYRVLTASVSGILKCAEN